MLKPGAAMAMALFSITRGCDFAPGNRTDNWMPPQGYIETPYRGQEFAPGQEIEAIAEVWGPPVTDLSWTVNGQPVCSGPVESNQSLCVFEAPELIGEYRLEITNVARSEVLHDIWFHVIGPPTLSVVQPVVGTSYVAAEAVPLVGAVSFDDWDRPRADRLVEWFLYGELIASARTNPGGNAHAEVRLDPGVYTVTAIAYADDQQSEPVRVDFDVIP